MSRRDDYAINDEPCTNLVPQEAFCDWGRHWYTMRVSQSILDKGLELPGSCSDCCFKLMRADFDEYLEALVAEQQRQELLLARCLAL